MRRLVSALFVLACLVVVAPVALAADRAEVSPAATFGYDVPSEDAGSSPEAASTSTTSAANTPTDATRTKSSPRTSRSSPSSFGRFRATKAAPRGQFSIRNWDGYPAGVPKPAAELRLLRGAEYDDARAAANQANAALRRANPEAYRGKQIHEIHPIKFGGSPTDPANKIALTPQEHYRFNAFWMRQQRYAEGGP